MSTAFLLLVLGTYPMVVEYYPSQDDCLHALAYLPEDANAHCIPAADISV